MLVLLHGYGGSVLHWHSSVEILKQHFRVIVPNLSHLFIGQNKIYFSVQVEILAQFMKSHFPNERISVAGVSYGGALAWAMSLQYPDLVDKLICINPMMPMPQDSFRLPELRYFVSTPISEKALRHALTTPIGKAFLRRATVLFRNERDSLAERVTQLAGRKLEFVAGMLYRFIWVLRQEDWTYWLQKAESLSKPSMLIFDGTDPLFSKEKYLDFSKLFRCQEVHELEDVGHLVVNKSPEFVAGKIVSFCQTGLMTKKSKKSA